MAKKKRKKYADNKKIPIIQKIGIYAIRNRKNNKYYIGSSINVYTRLKTQCMNINRFGLNSKMLVDILENNYDFDFLILETFEDNTITDKELRKRELFYISKYNSIENGYNTNLTWETGRYMANEKLICTIKNISKKKVQVKTPEYTKKAIENYRNKFDLIQIRFPKGTKEKVKNAGYNMNELVNKLLLEFLEESATQFPSEDNLPFD